MRGGRYFESGGDGGHERPSSSGTDGRCTCRSTRKEGSARLSQEGSYEYTLWLSLGCGTQAGCSSLPRRLKSVNSAGKKVGRLAGRYSLGRPYQGARVQLFLLGSAISIDSGIVFSACSPGIDAPDSLSPAPPHPSESDTTTPCPALQNAIIEIFWTSPPCRHP